MHKIRTRARSATSNSACPVSLPALIAHRYRVIARCDHTVEVQRSAYRIASLSFRTLASLASMIAFIRRRFVRGSLGPHAVGPQPLFLQEHRCPLAVMNENVIIGLGARQRGSGLAPFWSRSWGVDEATHPTHLPVPRYPGSRTSDSR